MRRKWQLAAIALGMALLPARRALSAEPPVTLSWQAPPECPQREAVLERVQAMLGSSSSRLTPLAATGVIRRRSAGFELELEIEDGRGGERHVFAQRCDELGGAAAVTLVLLLTSSGGVEGADASPRERRAREEGPRRPAPPESQTKTKTEPPASEPSDDDELETPTRRTARLRWLVDAPLFGLGIGPLPKPHPALGLGLGVERGALSLRLVGQWGLAQQLPASTTGYGVEVRRAAAGVWGCVELSRAAFGVSPCLQASLTHVFGRGYGPSLRPASQSETSAAVGVGLLSRWRIHERVALLFGGSAQVELSRPVLSLKPLGTVKQLAPFSGTLLLGPEWIF
jgi:hypothetical protein